MGVAVGYGTERSPNFAGEIQPPGPSGKRGRQNLPMTPFKRSRSRPRLSVAGLASSTPLRESGRSLPSSPAPVLTQELTLQLARPAPSALKAPPLPASSPGRLGYPARCPPSRRTPSTPTLGVGSFAAFTPLPEIHPMITTLGKSLRQKCGATALKSPILGPA